jgi:DNA-directed RNA polymerase specialized sigma24 family protein
MPDDAQTTSGEDADFCRLLRDVKAGQQSIETLLEHSVFRRKLPSICHALTFNHADAEDLANKVRYRVFTKFDRFKPDYGKSYGNCFAWVRRIAQRIAISESRRKSLPYIDARSDELFDVDDGQSSVATNVEVDAALQRFLTLVAGLAPRDRQILEIWIDGYFDSDDGFSLRAIEEKLSENGIECSHVTVGKVIQRVIETFVQCDEAQMTPAVSRKGEQTSDPREKDDSPSKDDDIRVKKTGS